MVCLTGQLVLNTISSNIRFTFQNIRNGIDFSADLPGIIIALLRNMILRVTHGRIVPFLFFFGIFLFFAFFWKIPVFFCFTGEQVYIDI